MFIDSFSKVQEVMQESAPLPSPVWLFVKGASSIHWFWRLNHKRELYQKPDNWLPLLAGHAANAFVANKLVRKSAHLLLIATRVDEYVQEVAVFREEVTRLNNAIDGYYTLSLEHRLSRIKICSVRVLQSLFRLTMHSFEVYDSFYRTDEAMNEVFVNGFKWLDRLSQNKQELLEGLVKLEHIVNQIFEKWGVEWDAKRLVGAFKGAVQVAEQGAWIVQKIAPIVKGAVAENAVFYFGLGRFVPPDWFLD